MSDPWLSIILPCWKDRPQVLAEVSRIAALAEAEGIEFLIADASKTSVQTTEVLASPATLIPCPRANRGEQLQRAAQQARGKHLLFHHADNQLTGAHLNTLRQHSQEIVVGAFYRDFAANWSLLGTLPFANALNRAWTRRFGILYGDQSPFFERQFYEELDGYHPLALMEDVELSDRVRKEYQPVFLDPPLRASNRRFNKKGKLKTKLENFWLIQLFRCGVSPEKLHRYYYRS